MKKLILSLVVVVAAAVSSYAQTTVYKPFRVGLGGGYAIPGGEGSKGGILFYVEPAYAINDNLQFGLRLETALIVRGYASDVNGTSNSNIDVAGVGSYTVNGQYYFNTNRFRPFIGAGLGLFSFASASFSDANGNVDDSSSASFSKLGFYPRVGFDAGHFTLSLDFNIVGANDVELPGGGKNSFKNNYVGIRFGGFFGGGKK